MYSYVHCKKVNFARIVSHEVLVSMLGILKNSQDLLLLIDFLQLAFQVELTPSDPSMAQC